MAAEVQVDDLRMLRQRGEAGLKVRRMVERDGPDARLRGEIDTFSWWDYIRTRGKRWS